jgi:hypothetical protein
MALMLKKKIDVQMHEKIFGVDSVTKGSVPFEN